MAADFWSSSHCNHWLLSRQRVAHAQQEDAQIMMPLELRLLRLHFITFMQTAAKILQLRQQVLATAIVYFRRFYVNNSFRVCDPMLVGATCIYLACKVEECSVTQANTMIEKFKQSQEPTFKRFPYTAEFILECEYYLLEELDCYLIVYHPYRPLTQYMNELKLEHFLQTAWNIVNDSYHTDVCLLYPPYLTALAAIFIAVVLSDDSPLPPPTTVGTGATNSADGANNSGEGSAMSAVVAQDAPVASAPPLTASSVVSNMTSASAAKVAEVRRWFSELNVDMDEVIEITQQIIDFYAFYSHHANNPDRNVVMGELVQRLRGAPSTGGSSYPTTVGAATTGALSVQI